jgi:hypothetical protein
MFAVSVLLQFGGPPISVEQWTNEKARAKWYDESLQPTAAQAKE